MGLKVKLFAVALAMCSGATAAYAQTNDVVRYYHTDAIGSVRMITDAAQQVLSEYDYLPFGEEWAGATFAEKLKFTGKERDSETDLDYFGARHYRRQSGRFTTVDPVMNVEAAVIDPQRWNRYTYALNRALGMIDPDGREAGYVYLPNGGMLSPFDANFPRSQYPVRDTAALAASAALGVFFGPLVQGAVNLGTGCFLSVACQAGTIGVLEGVAGGPPIGTPVTGGARFVADAGGTIRIFVKEGALEVGEHAALRAAERHVSIDAIERTVASQQPFPYFHNGVWKTGYYDAVNRIFVGTVDNVVTTVIGGASPRYIANLKGAP
jgi:RHS repeat-associated protein